MPRRNLEKSPSLHIDLYMRRENHSSNGDFPYTDFLFKKKKKKRGDLLH